MLSKLSLAVIIILTAVVQAAFFPALPAPWSLLSPAVMLVAALAGRFRFGSAFAAAVVLGLTADAVLPTAFGIHTAAMAALAAAAVPLVTRVFTHLTLPSFAAINASAYAAHRLFLAAAEAVQAVFSGRPAAAELVSSGGLGRFAVALALQVILATLTLLIVRRARKMFFSAFFAVRQ